MTTPEDLNAAVAVLVTRVQQRMKQEFTQAAFSLIDSGADNQNDTVVDCVRLIREIDLTQELTEAIYAAIQAAFTQGIAYQEDES